MQRRIEIAAAVFLVPTLIVGFYGANTWVPGQGKHWGFWVMVAVLVLLSLASLLAVLQFQRRSNEAANAAASERERFRSSLLRNNRPSDQDVYIEQADQEEHDTGGCRSPSAPSSQRRRAMIETEARTMPTWRPTSASS